MSIPFSEKFVHRSEKKLFLCLFFPNFQQILNFFLILLDCNCFSKTAPYSSQRQTRRFQIQMKLEEKEAEFEKTVSIMEIIVINLDRPLASCVGICYNNFKLTNTMEVFPLKRLISLIVPCYNEQEALPYFLPEVFRVAAEMADKADFEILFVDDGSRDGTLEVLRRFAKEDSRVKYLSFSRNFGKEAAMYAGFCNAKGDYVAVMDADLQDPPSLLPEMLRLLENEDYDSVATRRITRAGEPKIRSFFARMFYKIINRISDADIVDGARDFRLMRREMVDAIVAMSERNRFSKGIFGWVGFKTYWLPYENVERVAGQTKWSFWKLFRYSIDGFVNFSQTPLTISAVVGGAFTVLSALAILFIVIRKLCFGGSSVDGWASLVCIISFVSGLQLACLGIIGQYLSKMYLEVKGRPHYILRETNDDAADRVR